MKDTTVASVAGIALVCSGLALAASDFENTACGSMLHIACALGVVI